MAQVVKNADQTLTVTLGPGEQRVMVRWATELSVTPVALFTFQVTRFIRERMNEYQHNDGLTLQQKYDGLSPAQQAQVDTLLG